MSSLPLAPPPPAVDEIPYGTLLNAGMRHSLVIADFDFETYSEAGYVWDEESNKWQCLPGAKVKGLPIVGAASYTEHHTADIFSLAYNLKDGRGRRVWRPGMELPCDLFIHLMSGKLIEAWNVGFERWVWRNVAQRKYGFPPLPEPQLRCAMAKARAFALPGALENSAIVLNTLRKDPEGTRLMRKFSMPRNPTKTNPLKRIEYHHEPEEAQRYVNYNVQDIIAEAQASAAIPDLSPVELEYWQVDQRINTRGVHMDRASVQNCIAIVNQAHEKYNAEIFALTAGSVKAASELAKLQGWIGAHGVTLPSMDEEAITLALKGDLPAPVRRALEIREAVGSASVKKVFSISNQLTSESRLHDLFSFHAARTGRPTGNGPQPTNLPNSGPETIRCSECERHYGTHHSVICAWCGKPNIGKRIEWCAEAGEDVLTVIGTRSLAAVEHYYGDAMTAMSGCLRGLFTAKPGYDLVCADYTAIEAVVLAVLAGEQWRIDLFNNRGKIYEASGAKIFGLSYDAVIEHKATTGQHHICRKVGKVSELASGYGGWIGAWKAFGADEFMTDDQIKDAVLKWRAESPTIVEMWGGQKRGWTGPPELFGIEGAAISAILDPTKCFTYRSISYQMRAGALYCQLPSGRYIVYHKPLLGPSSRGGWQISYEGWNTNPLNGPRGWIRMNTHGGRLVENIVQAVSNDILRFASVSLERAGYPIVLHVYDEIVSEIPQGFGSVEEFERIMSVMPAWASGWPVRAAGGWRGLRYRK